MSVELLTFAKSVAESSNPPQPDIRRAMSACYYALFHKLCEDAADIFHGKNSPQSRAYLQTYRAMNHKELYSSCKRCEEDGNYNSPQDIKDFAGLVCLSQDDRQKADYYPLVSKYNFTADALRARVQLVEQNIVSWAKQQKKHRQALLASILFPKRKDIA